MSSLKENKMGTMPIGRLLLTMALPMALSMLVQALYNVVDSAFVATVWSVNQDALNAVSLAFPVQNHDDRRGGGHWRGRQRPAVASALGEGDAGHGGPLRAERTVLSVPAAGLVFAVIGLGLFPRCSFSCASRRRHRSGSWPTATSLHPHDLLMRARSACSARSSLERTCSRPRAARSIPSFTQGTGAVLNIILDPIHDLRPVRPAAGWRWPARRVATGARPDRGGDSGPCSSIHRKNPDVRLHRCAASGPDRQHHRPHSGRGRAVHRSCSRHRLGDGTSG